MNINLKIGLEICVLIQNMMKRLTFVDFKCNTIITQSQDEANNIIISIGKEDLQQWSTINIFKDSVWMIMEFHS